MSSSRDAATDAGRITRVGVVGAGQLARMMITAAVDETALAADSMSHTIAAIRVDTENVAQEIDQVGRGFESLDTQLGDLKTSASQFVARVAA